MKCLVLLTAILLANFASRAQQPGEGVPPPEAVKHWQDARFGMFIHWGPVTLKGTEIGWSRGAEVPIEEYDQLYKKFNPTGFNADEWVATAKAAGIRYLVITAKHHDGFCLWDTKLTDYNIMNTPFRHDVVKELAAACKKQGIEFGIYYSTCDWFHPAFPLGSPGGSTLKPQPNMDAYDAFLQGQVKELLTNYGQIFTIWFDIPQSYSSRWGIPMVAGLRKLQPNIMVNNRAYSLEGQSDLPHGAVGDYATPEQTIGSFDMDRPWESCMTLTLGGQWAWKPNDSTIPLKDCLQMLVRTNGGNGNLLLNVGPNPDGRIEPRQVALLKEMGNWLKKNGASIYGTRGGPWISTKDLVSTRRGDRIYLHILNATGEVIKLNALPVKMKSARVLNGPAVAFETVDGVLSVNLAKDTTDPIDTIVEMTIEGSALDLAPLPASYTGLIDSRMKASASAVYEGQSEYAASKAIDSNPDTRWATPQNTRECWIEIDLLKTMTFGRIEIDEVFAETASRVKKFELQSLQGSVWKTFYAGSELGAHFKVSFPAVTASKVRLKILDASDGPTVSEVRLFPPST